MIHFCSNIWQKSRLEFSSFCWKILVDRLNTFKSFKSKFCKKKKKRTSKESNFGINPESVYSTLLNRLIVSSRFRYLHNWRRKFRILESYPYSRYNVIVRVLSSFHCWSIDISILFSPFTCSNFIQVKRRLLKEAVIIYTGVWNTFVSLWASFGSRISFLAPRYFVLTRCLSLSLS